MTTLRVSRLIGIVVGSLALSLLAPLTALAATVGGAPADMDPAVGSVGNGHYPIVVGDMFISVPYAFYPAGKITFDVRNAGALTHEVVVIRTDVAPGSIAKDPADPSRADETGNVGEVDDLAPGSTGTVTLDLAPGRYAFICNEPGHFAAGMHAGFVAATFVGVTLKEMLIGLDTPVVKAGPVVFSVSNKGTLTHEMVVLKTNALPDAIPADPQDASKADEAGSVGEVDDVVASRFFGGVLDLTPGSYVLICNEPGHYAAGMRIGLLVQ